MEMMMNNLSKIGLATIALLALGYGIGRYLVPPKTVEVIKEVKVIEKAKDSYQREITRPDGTKETVTIVKERDRETGTKEASKTIDARPNYKASALAGYDLTGKKPVYGLLIEKRIFSNISAGVWGTTNKEVGLSVNYEF
jgi:hypothetical protein